MDASQTTFAMEWLPDDLLSNPRLHFFTSFFELCKRTAFWSESASTAGFCLRDEVEVCDILSTNEHLRLAR